MLEIQNRRSVRKYKNSPVQDAQILELLESARQAPSGKNSQPWRFIVVREEQTRQKLATADHNQQWMTKAPVFIVCVADVTRRAPGQYENLDEASALPALKQVIRDTAAAIENMLLQAQHMGLAACWTAWFEQRDIRPILGIPDDKYVCGIVTVGYADEQPQARPRRPLEELVCYEKWQ